MIRKIQFQIEVVENEELLSEPDRGLVLEAKKSTEDAYAPYSGFKVAAVARLKNGALVSGTNQENASYPVGICAERVLLGSAATLYPGVGIDTMAISYDSKEVKSDHPISPCGMCRQSLLEYETRTEKPIRLILAGQEGKIYIVKTIKFLLPFAFTSEELL